MKKLGLILITHVGQLIPLRIKLYIVNFVPILSSLNRLIIKSKQKAGEQERLIKIVENTHRLISGTKGELPNITILVVNVLKEQKERAYDYNISTIEEHQHLQIIYSNLSIGQGDINPSNLINQLPEFDFIIFKKPEDSLLPGAFKLISIVIHEARNTVDAVYWDHITVDDSKQVIDHNLKPDWAPDYLLCYNYIGRAVLLSKNTFKNSSQTFNVKSWQSSIYKTLINLSTRKSNILHIAEPLQYLIHETTEEYKKLLNNEYTHVKKALIGTASVSNSTWNTRRITRICQHGITSTIIIPTRDGFKILKKCIDSILASELKPQDEILIVNNQSHCNKTLKYLEFLSTQKIARVIDYNHPFNYSAINNFAVAQTKSDVIVLLNNDIEVISKSWLQELKANAMRKEIGCAGVKLLYPKKTIQHAGVIVGYGGVADHAFKHESKNSSGYMNRLITDQNYTAVTAACLAIQRQLYIQINGLNETDLKVAFNDVDLCLKLFKLGLRNIWLSHNICIHHESITRGLDLTPEKRNRFSREIEYMKDKWNTNNFNDPAYNKNLSLKSHSFSVK